MKRFRKSIISIVLSLVMVITSVNVMPISVGIVKAADTIAETYTENGFTLTIQQTVGNTVDSSVVEKIKEIYFNQYPKMRARYNPTRPRAITMVFSPDYDGVAYTMGTTIVYSVAYLKSNPNDVDCATHELFHVVQGGYSNYGSSAFATAFCEGVADYARSVYGMYNSEGGWSLPAYSSSQSYTDSYRVTARFLTWVQQRVDSSIIYNLNKTMHAGTYTDDLWVEMTGKTVDQLWSEYAADPDIDKIGLSGQKTESYGIDANDVYKIISAESGQALSVKNNSTDDGANIQQENYVDGNTAQQWKFVYLGDGMYNIINVNSGKGLDVADGNTSNGANIQQYTVSNGGNNNQKWIVYERGSQYTLFPVCGNGTMVADLTSSSHDAGANIQLYTWNKTKAQSFVIQSISGTSDSAYTLKAFEKIEAEDYTTSTTSIGVSIDESEDRSGGANIGGLIAGAWTKYSGVIFDKDAAGLSITYCNPSSDSYVNVYVDSMDSTPVGKISTPHNSSDWTNYSTVTGDLTTKITSGTHDIYLEFVNDSMAGHAQNCDYFTFVQAQEETTTAEQETEPKTFNGLSRIEAEDFTQNNGVVIDKDSDGNPKNIGGVQNGNWTAYDNVVFEKTAKAIEINYSCEQSRGGKIYIYVDSMDTTPVGVLQVSETGTDWSTYVTDRVNLDNEISAGTHTIYLKFETSNGYVANVDYFTFLEKEVIVVSDSVKVEGYQISANSKGSRVIGSVEPEINGKSVTGWGLVYGVDKVNGQSFNLSDEDMKVNSESKYVMALDSTPVGTSGTVLGTSDTATYFVRTTLFGAFTSAEYSAEYKVRAYAILADGSYVYSDVKKYCVFNVADYLYKNRKMNTKSAHQYLYDDILTVVDSAYQEVDYNWGTSIVKP